MREGNILSLGDGVHGGGDERSLELNSLGNAGGREGREGEKLISLSSL